MASSMPCRLSKCLRRQQEREDATGSAGSSQSVSSVTSSKSIPIQLNPDDVYEKWEIQEQEMIAEERDFIMFHRIVHGMMRTTRRRQSDDRFSTSSSISCQSENKRSIASVMRTRYKGIDSVSNKDSESPVDCDHEAEMYNRREGLSNVDTSTEIDRPPDAIFIIDM